MKTTSIIFALLAFALNSPSNADLVTFRYTGTVTSISQVNLDLFSGGQVGDRVSGTFSYSTDPAEYDDFQSNPTTNTTIYSDNAPFTAFNWTFVLRGVGRELADVTPGAGSSAALFVDDTPAAGDLLFNANATNNQMVTFFDFVLQDFDGNVFAGQLPPSELDLDSFESTSGLFFFQPNNQSFSNVRFEFTSLARVPEPTSILGFFVGLACFGSRRRRFIAYP